MPALQRGEPPRSPERQRLAEAIDRLAAATTRAERVAEAGRRASRELFDEALPAESAAAEALAEARQRRPQAIVDRLLGAVPSGAPTLTEAEAALRRAEERVAETREARSLLEVEASRASDALHAEQRNLGNAVAAVVEADPARDAALIEFKMVANRALRLAMALKTAGLELRDVDGHGLRLGVADVPTPLGSSSAFRPDSAWQSALAALRKDPDAPLPGLPEPVPPPDAGDSEQVAA
jgi:hypothetical protein